jgi:NADPH:quinone reductase-like Zn-dependent oxidoreductase
LIFSNTLSHSISAPSSAAVYHPNVDRIFGLDDIVAAHRYMESNEATGKVVVLP